MSSTDRLAMLKVPASAVVVGGVTVDDPAGKTTDCQFVDVCYVVERVGGQLVGGQADLLAIFAGEHAPIKNEQQLVALGWVGCPVGDQKAADRRGDAQLLASFSGSGLGRGLTVLDVAARDVAVALVRRLDEHDPV